MLAGRRLAAASRSRVAVRPACAHTHGLHDLGALKKKGKIVDPEVVAKRAETKALLERMNYRILPLNQATKKVALLHLGYAAGEDSDSTLAAAALDDEYDPELWSVLWPSAIAASEELAKQPELTQVHNPGFWKRFPGIPLTDCLGL